jgi:H+/Cl- antiporter ClcA
MSTAFIVYLASIADSMRGVFLVFSVIFGLCTIVMCISLGERGIEDFSRNYRRKWAIALVLTMSFSIVLIGATPSTSDVYKIAGVSGQRKAIIDTNGVVQESQQRNGNQ